MEIRLDKIRVTLAPSSLRKVRVFVKILETTERGKIHRIEIGL
jgi:hypothetical protein